MLETNTQGCTSVTGQWGKWGWGLLTRPEEVPSGQRAEHNKKLW